MKTTDMRIELESGEQVRLALPNGQEITVGFGGDGQVPKDKPHIFIGSSKNGGHNFEGCRPFEVLKNGKMEEYCFE